MAQRPIWKGHLRLALVSYPVALYSARHERETVCFNMINPAATGSRIKMVSQDAQTGEDVARRDTVREMLSSAAERLMDAEVEAKAKLRPDSRPGGSGGVVRHCEIEAEQVDYGADQLSVCQDQLARG